MQVKEVFSKKIFNIIFFKFIIIFFLFFSLKINSEENSVMQNVLVHLKNIDEFSSSFLQIQDNEISEGIIFIKDKRIRIEYTSPTNIVFVFKENKGMYFNVDLKEVQYFNPKNTIAKFLMNLFNTENYLLNSKIVKKESYLYILKKINLDEKKYNIKIIFEEKPFNLRKIEIINEGDKLTFTIVNPNYNPDLNDKIFSLAHPLLS